jgi:hypothetical protein
MYFLFSMFNLIKNIVYIPMIKTLYLIAYPIITTYLKYKKQIMYIKFFFNFHFVLVILN